MRRSVLFYFILFFIGVSLIGGSVFNTYSQFVAEGPLAVRTEFVAPRGASVRKIARMLKNQGIIDSPSIFELGVRASTNSRNIKAGEYSFPPRASMRMVMDIMTGGQTYVRRLIIPEGKTSWQIVEMLKSTTTLTGEIARVPRNGTLLPETYYYSNGDTRESIIRRMTNAMQRTMDELWPARDPNVPFKTPEEAIILASIVERETSIPLERPRVASVFINRLEKRMRLQSDPTVIFGLTNGTGVLNRQLFSNDLKKPSPYNTYIIYGLPASAISNPGVSSITAVLHPLRTKDLYFVADGTGGHIFATNYEDHQANVNQWRRVKKDQNALRTLRKQAKPSAFPTPFKTPQNLGSELVSEVLEEGEMPMDETIGMGDV